MESYNAKSDYYIKIKNTTKRFYYEKLATYLLKLKCIFQKLN